MYWCYIKSLVLCLKQLPRCWAAGYCRKLHVFYTKSYKLVWRIWLGLWARLVLITFITFMKLNEDHIGGLEFVFLFKLFRFTMDMAWHKGVLFRKFTSGCSNTEYLLYFGGGSLPGIYSTFIHSSSVKAKAWLVLGQNFRSGAEPQTGCQFILGRHAYTHSI